MSNVCLCGSGKIEALCCLPYLQGQHYPSTPESLMRSRYSAYAKANIDYILQTMRGPAAAGFDAIAAKEWAERVKWLRLRVIKAEPVAEEADCGYVEFIAYYIDQGRRQTLHEVSEFHLIEGRWYYWDGKH